MSRLRIEDDLEEERRRLRALPRARPQRIAAPGPGQESVWEYPRPPRIERVKARLQVEHAGVAIADTRRGLRVIETASPPVYYFPPAGVRRDRLEPSETRTFCEWKGVARYWSLRTDSATVRDVAWSYPEPDPGFEAIRDWIAFFASRVDACYVDGERVVAQPGDYYGGWITQRVTGPFKGEPGTEGW